MAVRTTDALVGGIIEVTASISLTPFIAAANTLVTQCCTGDAVSTDYTADDLQQIETWLAAHFYTVRDMRAERERAGSVEEKFQSKVDLGFSTSHYGQMAMTLDYQGGLASLNQDIIAGNKKTVSISWLGVEEADADPSPTS